MTTILKDTDLTDATAGNVIAQPGGWETSVGSAANVILYTYNWGAAYSDDGGDTFHSIDAAGLCQRHDKSLAGDQVVTFIPSIDQFAWVMLTGDQNLVLAMASPREITWYGGTVWVTWLIPFGNFEDGRSNFDRPSVSFGENFLYIGVNLGSRSIAIRLSLNELAARGSVHLSYFLADDDVFWMRATQSTGRIGYFASLTQVKAYNGETFISNIRVYEWPEDRNTITSFDVRIAAVPTEGSPVPVPSGTWLGNPLGSLQILGLTRSKNELWAAWWAYCKVPNPPIGMHPRDFPYPHIEIAVIDLRAKKLKKQLYIWNREVAFVFPDLATNARGDVGLAFCWGGSSSDPQFGVGMLTWPAQWPPTSLISLTSGPSAGAGHHYISIRKWYPGVTQFCAAGFCQPLPGPTNQPHYVFFRP
jgi:hypothetical protein